MKKYHSLIQGSKEWHIHRDSHMNASDAPAMLGESEYKSRDALLKEIALDIKEEISPSLQQRFDDGHKNEALAKPLAEKLIDEELFSPTVSLEFDGLKLSASLDGETMDESVIFEHKTLNKKLAVDIPNGIIKPMYEIQMEQQLLISGAERCLFMASKNGDEESMVYIWYRSNPNLRQRIIDGWKQFVIDLENYTLVAEVVEPEAKPIESLPSLQIMVTGAITNSNLDIYHKSAITFIESINTDLQTDEDFANAEKTVKFLKNAETELQNVKKQIFSQTSDIEKAVNTIDHIFESSKVKRLSLDKLVKSQKEVRKAEIVNKSKHDFDTHMESLLSELDGQTFTVSCDFSGAVKGKRTIESMRNAVNTELANRKIEANGIAALIRSNLNTYKEMAGDHNFLFNDLSGLIQSNSEHFKLTVANRIDNHKKSEQERLDKEREQIRLEEERKAKDKLEAEQEELRKQEVIDAQKIVDDKETEERETANAIALERAQSTAKSVKEIQKEEPTPPEEDVVEHDNVGNEPVCIKNKSTVLVPTDRQIVSALMRHFYASEEKVCNWLLCMDFENLKKAS